MANGNPFFVQPGGSYGPGLQELAGTLMQAQQMRQQSQQRQQQAIQQDYVNSMFDAVNNPEQIPTIAQNLKMRLGQAGAQPQQLQQIDRFIELYNQNPDEAVKRLKSQLAYTAPQKYQAYQKATSVTGGGEATANIKDFNFYKTLLRESPEQAEKFATQVGISKPQDRTTAIKEFEYAERNPKFALRQKEKEDKAIQNDLKKQLFKQSSDLRKEYVKQSGEFIKVRDAYIRVIQSTKNPSPAGDLSLIFNYMKMLDPGSVVRESEFATAAITGSYGQRIQGLVQKALSGERLTPIQRNDFLKKTSELLHGAELQHEKRKNNYTRIANKNNLPIEEVIVDLGKINPEQEFGNGSIQSEQATQPVDERKERLIQLMNQLDRME